MLSLAFVVLASGGAPIGRARSRLHHLRGGGPDGGAGLASGVPEPPDGAVSGATTDSGPDSLELGAVAASTALAGSGGTVERGPAVELSRAAAPPVPPSRGFPVALRPSQVATLRASAKESAQGGQWREAGKLRLLQACELLLVLWSGGDATESERRVSSELQRGRLSLALCLSKQRRWREAVDTCTAVIGANVRCGTAWFRRGQALHALGEAEAAVWDLQRAAKLLPGNKQVARALSRAEAASAATKPASPLSAFGGLGGALLDSPLLAGLGGGGASGLIGFAKTALAYRRRAKLLWRSLKPYLPLLFYAVVLLPTLLALWQGTIKLPLAVWPRVSLGEQ
ncbi:hypothetical protein EMIHUDRAFT_222982 [Emiliania huxleyi CCMP1516]|uniref:Uncharacterized protein n=2 Tax=Emiliania huxleyi TaxID=2903 RepID=A0A0D3KWJ5_EMIH1|nr:hypothetical protein EMIHUDRAFT_222982 [Emiliania huxleyi CCMP1516]EOD40130.1 hypothetical protein EMIHUDRAFT_222982 [Emiliania huxleyi CCMP1516]|eukprot:XP_005792559.1 hypothetical protein EMIHUDRAFT_222982 [Emiliania huxleyi CCMP1516]